MKFRFSNLYSSTLDHSFSWRKFVRLYVIDLNNSESFNHYYLLVLKRIKIAAISFGNTRLLNLSSIRMCLRVNNDGKKTNVRYVHIKFTFDEYWSLFSRSEKDLNKKLSILFILNYLNVSSYFEMINRHSIGRSN